jgi:hypothetical protein
LLAFGGIALRGALWLRLIRTFREGHWLQKMGFFSALTMEEQLKFL